MNAKRETLGMRTISTIVFAVICKISMRSRILDFQCFRNLVNNFADKQKSHKAESNQTAKLTKTSNSQF